MSKETKERVKNAFHAMKAIGISDDKVKPVLKNLLKLYDKDWKLIEEENYRVLADAIFEREEAEAAERSKKIVTNDKEDCSEEEAQSTEEPERPLKRLRHRYQDGQTSNLDQSNSSMSRTPFVRPKDEPEELPETNMLKLSDSQGIVGSSHHNTENKMVKSHTFISQSLGTDRGKQSTSSKSSVINEGCDSGQPIVMNRIQQNIQSSTEAGTSPEMRLRDVKKVSVPSQPGEKRSVPESSSDAVAVREPNTGYAIDISPKQESIVTQALIKPKDEPITDDIPFPEVSTAVIHPDTSNARDSICRNGTIQKNDGPEQSLQFVDKMNSADCSAAANKPGTNGNLAMISADNQGARGLCVSSLNGSVDSQFDTEGPLHNILQLVPPENDVDDGSHMNKMDGGDDCRLNQEIVAEETNGLRLAAGQHPLVDPEIIRSFHDVFDVAKGLEKVTITLVNEVNDERPPSFFYIPQNAVFQNAHLNFSLARIGDKNCCSTCYGDCLSLLTPCSCAHEAGGEFAYTVDGLVKEELLNECISINRDPKKHCQFFCKECVLERTKNEDVIEPCKGHLLRKFIKECWCKCGCNKQCGNRVVQRGISRNLQVFMTPEGKGWGLRTLEDLPKGAFVCEYVGEVLTYAELLGRVSRLSQVEKQSYPVLLDAVWGADEALKDEEALCLDATCYGNVSRFINHRCYDSNLVEIPVEIETPDHHYYHLAFFATRNVKAMEELTLDYGIDFDDHGHPIKAFHCVCGSKFCRNIKRSSRGEYNYLTSSVILHACGYGPTTSF